MRLRNKKTGEIIEYSIGLNEWSENEQEWYLFGNYDSIDELKEEWETVEDPQPKEPLIKDEKIRKAVRAWAKTNGVNRAILGQVNNDELVKKSPMTAFGCHISFECSLGLERGRNYTIEELCGEEE